MSNTKMDISMTGEAFDEFKSQFDDILQATLINMTQKGVEDAKISVTFDVHIDNQVALNGEVVMLPTFRHNINSSMQVKYSAKGALCGDYRMLFDEKAGRYVMYYNDNGQIGMFDDGNGRYVDYPREDDDYEYEAV